MQTRRNLLLCCLTGVLALGPAAAEDRATGPVARMNASSAGIEWSPLAAAYDEAVLTVTGPEGYQLRQRFAAGQPPVLGIFDQRGQRLPDGLYTYELRLAPRLAAGLRDRLAAARSRGDDAAIARLQRSLPPGPWVQSGSFAVLDGAIVDPGLPESHKGESDKTEQAATAQAGSNLTPATANGLSNVTAATQVIAMDLIVQGSACVGIDCTATESFGFDTIRLKENNLRIKFEDTSVGAFPTTDWQLTANESASGGQNKLSIDDVTAATVPFTVEGGSTTNSLYIDSTGRVGFRTATPVLDLHVNTSNTPALRLEQNSAGGFTAQTWDIGANEANFFVRDVTSGSRLPLRIRPGAPTSSVDISSDGDVGIGTGSPSEELHLLRTNDANTISLTQNSNATGTSAAAVVRTQADVANTSFIAHGSGRTLVRFGQVLGGWNELAGTAGNGQIVGTVNATPLILGTNSTNRIHITSAGNVGVGTTTPAHPLQMASGAHVTAGGVWTDASSRALKENIIALTSREALQALQGLAPVRYNYKVDKGDEHVGFIAEDVPELIATPDRASLAPMDVVAVLTKVVQEQQKTIAALAAKLAELERRQQQE